VSDALYEDAKSVIMELLTAEVAESVVPQIACRAGRQLLPDKPGSDIPYVVALPQECRQDDQQCVENQKNGSPPKEQYYRLQALEHYPKTLRRAYSRQFGALRTSVIEESADLAAILLYNGLQDSRPLVTFEFGSLSTAQENACAKAVGDKLAEDPRSDGASPLDRACQHPSDGATNVRCQLALALRSELENKPTLANEHLIRASGYAVGEAVVEGMELTREQRQRVFEWTILALRKMFAKESITAVELRNTLAQQIATLTKTTAEDVEDQWQTKKFDELLDRIAAQWQVAESEGADGKLNLSVFVSLLAGKDGALTNLCEKVTAGQACKAMKSLVSLDQRLLPIVRSAARGDFREVAHLVILTMFSGKETRNCADPDDTDISPDCHRDLYRRFTESLVVYVVDSVDDGAPSEAAQGAFRAAAREVIQELGKGGGFDRRQWSLWTRPVGAFWLPGLSLWVSWNAGYVNRGGGSLRYVASMNLLTFRGRLAYVERYYAAVHFSLVDPLAPLSELAVRDATGASYQHDSRLALNVVAPHLDIVFGIPALSRHLLVGAGASLRMVAPLLATTHIEGTAVVRDYNYEYLWNKLWSDGSRYIEFGFIVKYEI
jgi:hypothetical protein